MPTKATGKECTGPFASLPAGKDGWHFVLPNASGDDFNSLSATFSNGTTAVVTSKDSAAPSTGTGWSGYIDNAGASDKHVYLITDAGWTLTAASADVEGATADAYFNLSHTCGGTPTSPSPSASTSPSASASPSATPQPSDSPDPSGTPGTTPSPSEPGLPVTGTAVTGIVLAGLVLVAGGAVTLFMVRRRRDLPTEA
ncbi:LPXTG cell wall anchor domain-containing protein [Catellatospora sp. IY07-71]|uniref:LPXTG cell wall anchor domain-containing protein n=1 Tax=Catellatospora sp. IY07-71 TaxID=2728827 RepID=UPI001BB32360|nr:LPXTG cell wall anchor domain-containing protein [Catellatospora sp. IY07-71]